MLVFFELGLQQLSHTETFQEPTCASEIIIIIFIYDNSCLSDESALIENNVVYVVTSC